MKSKKTIIIIAIAFAVGLLTYMATKNTEHSEHDHAGYLETPDAHEEHDGHDDHEGHDSHENQEQAIELTAKEIKGIGLKTAVAGSGTIDVHINLAGEIRVNQDRMAHVVPRVEGVVTDVKKKLGDTVKAGETIAVIESRELADAKAGQSLATGRAGGMRKAPKRGQ